MAKGPLVTDSVETVIAFVYKKHSNKWKAPRVRKEVDLILNKGKTTGWPSLSSVQKVLAKVRKKANEPNEEDQPWSTATLGKFPIPPDALPAVLKVWKFRIEKGDTFTIREAKWAARLSGHEQDIERLFFLASRHARTEFIFDLIGRPFDSTELDRSLMGLPVEMSGFKSMLWLLAETRAGEIEGVKDGVEQVQNIIQKGKLKMLLNKPIIT